MNPPDGNDPSTVPNGPAANEIGTRYLAYCDVLGFSDRILSDFDATLQVYREFGQLMSKLPANEAQITIYSDAVLITATALDKLLVATQSLWFVALTHHMMIRGAITKGRYWEERIGNHFLVASDALVRAVKLEKSVGVPAVVLADDIEIPDDFWIARYVHGVFVTPLLHFRDRNIVNPFNRLWFRSAAIRAEELMAESPAHQDKYLWFLALYRAVEQQQELIPFDALQRFISAGVLREKSQLPSEPPDTGAPDWGAK